MEKVSRRGFLQAGLVAGAATTVACSELYSGSRFNQIFTASVSDQRVLDTFDAGVASGDPTASSVVIWTHLNRTRSVDLDWQVAEDLSFDRSVSQGRMSVNAVTDFCAKVDVSGLKPGQVYYYRFVCDGVTSEVGRTRTLPVGELDKLTFAVASCSNFPYGFFNAYEVIGADAEIDFVLHLGDYIYEYGQEGWGGESGKLLERNHLPAHEIVSLEDYRVRHKQYKRDRASRLMHAAHPLIPIWDDHESANNPWMGGAQNHQPDTEGDWSLRRDASVQSYFEWMPVREPTTDAMSSLNQQRQRLWRHFEFGDLATLTTLETRHTGRDVQVNYSDHVELLQQPGGRERFMKEILGREERNILSQEMEAFLAESLSQSSHDGVAWRLLGNQIPMARTHVPPLKGRVQRKQSDAYDPVAQEHAQFERLGELDLPLYLDTWDGYPAARERFYDLARESGVSDLLVLTGDSHSFWINQLYRAGSEAMGVELGTAGVTSPGDFESYGDEGAKQFDQLLVDHNREISWTDCRHRGFIKVQITRREAVAEFVSVKTVLKPDQRSEVIKTATITRENGQLRLRS